MSLRVIPITLEEANLMVAHYHRHHQPKIGHRFSVGVVNDKSELVGAAICGRPVSKEVDQRYVVEVSRLVTDGTYNACSILYAAAARAGKALGFHKIQTYILQEEPGTSLKASGWCCDGLATKPTWHIYRDRPVISPLGAKMRWSKVLNADAH